MYVSSCKIANSDKKSDKKFARAIEKTITKVGLLLTNSEKRCRLLGFADKAVYRHSKSPLKESTEYPCRKNEKADGSVKKSQMSSARISVGLGF